MRNSRGKEIYCNVKVKKVQYTLSSNQIRLYIGQSKKIKVKTNASNKKFKVIWKSLNNKVAKN